MMPRLSIQAELEIVIDGDTRVRVEGDGGQSLKVHFPNLRSVISLWRRHGTVLTPILERVAGGLSVANVTVEILVNGRQIARVGSDADPGVLSRFITTTPTELNPGNILRALFS